MMKQALLVAALVASTSAFAPANRPIATPKFAVVALHAEPTTMDDWKEQDFEADLAKVQKEAEERLDEKVSELLSNIESVGTN